MDVKEFEYISKNIFGPIYPIIAKDIVRKTDIVKGKCLDIGAGPGRLGIELAKITDLDIVLFDVLKEMIEICNINIREANLTNNIQALEGDVHALPFENDTFDLIISRGSLFFWEDLTKAFSEIYRVMKKGAKTYIGGGYGSKKLREEVPNEFIKHGLVFKGGMLNKVPNQEEVARENLKNANINTYEIYKSEDDGFWIIIYKE